jgi:hypothetical protein
MTRTALVAYHGRCFDGMCSAVAASRLLEAVRGPGLAFEYRGLEHQPGGSHVPPEALTGDLNAVVDFRYTTSPKLDWWFDHHGTGIVGDEERAHFASNPTRGATMFFEPSYGSCCKLIADVATQKLGLDFSALAEMVRWADIIDTASFADARTAVELREPALQLMTVIEAHGNDAFLAPRIVELRNGASLHDVATSRSVSELFAPLFEQHQRTIAAIDQRARCSDGVVEFDLIGSGDDRYNKFIPYFLHPDARYCVAVTAGATRTKVSVGSNPWSKVPRTHDISELCARYGGGGHPVVGAVSLPRDAADKARAIAAEIAAALRVG